MLGDPDQNCYSDGCNIENMLLDTTFNKIEKLLFNPWPQDASIIEASMVNKRLD